MLSKQYKTIGQRLLRGEERETPTDVLFPARGLFSQALLENVSAGH